MEHAQSEPAHAVRRLAPGDRGSRRAEAGRDRVAADRRTVAECQHRGTALRGFGGRKPAVPTHRLRRAAAGVAVAYFRIILSENRCPLFGMMRYFGIAVSTSRAQNEIPAGSTSSLKS